MGFKSKASSRKKKSKEMFNPSLKNVIFTPWMRDIVLSIRRMIQWRPEPFARIDKDGDRYSFSIPSNYSTGILQVTLIV
jgi:hypothetical protein